MGKEGPKYRNGIAQRESIFPKEEALRQLYRGDNIAVAAAFYIVPETTRVLTLSIVHRVKLLTLGILLPSFVPRCSIITDQVTNVCLCKFESYWAWN